MMLLAVVGLEGDDSAPHTHRKHSPPRETKYPDDGKGDVAFESQAEHMIVENYSERRAEREDASLRVPSESVSVSDVGSLRAIEASAEQNVTCA